MLYDFRQPEKAFESSDQSSYFVYCCCGCSITASSSHQNVPYVRLSSNTRYAHLRCPQKDSRRGLPPPTDRSLSAPWCTHRDDSRSRIARMGCGLPCLVVSIRTADLICTRLRIAYLALSTKPTPVSGCFRIFFACV